MSHPQSLYPIIRVLKEVRNLQRLTYLFKLRAIEAIGSSAFGQHLWLQGLRFSNQGPWLKFSHLPGSSPNQTIYNIQTMKVLSLAVVCVLKGLQKVAWLDTGQWTGCPDLCNKIFLAGPGLELLTSCRCSSIESIKAVLCINFPFLLLPIEGRPQLKPVLSALVGLHLFLLLSENC